MGQVHYKPGEQKNRRSEYPDLFANRTENFAGFTWQFLPRNTFDDTPEKRLKVYEDAWASF